MESVSLRAPTGSNTAPVIRRIGTDDIRAALREGWADFEERRGDILVIAILYPAFSLTVAFMSLGGLPLILFFPMAAGLSLVGPVVACGFYELARRREAGLESDWRHFFDVVQRPAFGSLLAVAALMAGLFGTWVWVAGAIHDAFLGTVPPPSVGAFLAQLFGTPGGWAMMLVGDLVGLAFALAVLVLTWVAMPMLVDRDVDAATAITTSIRAFSANRAVALRWGLTVAALLIVGAIPAFLGLAVVLPWLGYATWHLYTRLVERNGFDDIQI